MRTIDEIITAVRRDEDITKDEAKLAINGLCEYAFRTPSYMNHVSQVLRDRRIRLYKSLPPEESIELTGSVLIASKKATDELYEILKRKV